MYKEEKTVEFNVEVFLGFNKHIKKKFDNAIKKLRIEFCKQKKWKLRECVVSVNPNIKVTFHRKLKESEQTMDWTELIERDE